MIASRVAAYLISLAVGYWVMTLADKQSGFTQKIGKAIAWIIILVSLCGPLCIAASRFCCHGQMAACMSMRDCPMGGPGMMNCPDMGEKAPAMPPPAKPGDKGGKK